MGAGHVKVELRALCNEDLYKQNGCILSMQWKAINIYGYAPAAMLHCLLEVLNLLGYKRELLEQGKHIYGLGYYHGNLRTILLVFRTVCS